MASCCCFAGDLDDYHSLLKEPYGLDSRHRRKSEGYAIAIAYVGLNSNLQINLILFDLLYGQWAMPF